MFAPFSQEESSSTRRFRGLGLGLSIVRNLAELHGGNVTVTSPGVDQGSRFEVAIPCADGGARVADSESLESSRDPGGDGKPLPRLRVLVVDDDLRRAKSFDAC